jgi:hypothetical protein
MLIIYVSMREMKTNACKFKFCSLPYEYILSLCTPISSWFFILHSEYMLIIMLICLLLFLDLIEGQTHCESFVVHFVGRFIFFYSILIWTERYNLVAVTPLHQAAVRQTHAPSQDQPKNPKETFLLLCRLNLFLLRSGRISRSHGLTFIGKIATCCQSTMEASR